MRSVRIFASVIGVRAGLLAVLVLLALPAVSAAQSGAGDNQYQDPFGPGGTGSHHATKRASDVARTHPASSNSSGSSAGTSASSSSGSLTQAPPASTTGSSASTSSSGASTATGASAAGSSRLPKTGFDVIELVLLGSGLLICGLGLRLRTVDVGRF